MTGPWPGEVDELVAGPHEVTARVQILPTDALEWVDLDCTDVRIGWDEGVAPRCWATLTCPLPDTSLIPVLDPRLRVRVRLLVGYRLRSGTLDEQVVATLDLREIEETQPDDTLTLVCAGVETRVIDHALAWLATGSSTRGFITDALAATGVTLVVAPDVVDVLEAYDTSEDVTANLWSQVDDMADVLGADLLDGGDGVLHLVRRPVRASRSVHVLRTGPGGTLTRARSRRSREAWHNTVVLHYSDVDGVHWRSGTAFAAAPHDPDVVGYVTLVEERTGKPTQAAANAAAAAVLRRQLTGGRSYSGEAIAAWWVRAGDTVTVESAREDQERHLVSRVELSWPANTMTVTTRTPEA